MRLCTDTLGKTEHYVGDDVWTHVAFAQRALDLAKWAGIAKGISNIWQVRDSIPEVVREKVHEKQDNWTMFCDVIKQVEVSHIKEVAQKHATEQQEKSCLHSEMDTLRTAVWATKTPDTPTKGISSQLSKAMISQIAPTNATTAPTVQNPFVAAGGGRGNLFRGQQATGWSTTCQLSSATNPKEEIAIVNKPIPNS